MEGERMFYKEEAAEIKNFLLEGPELISSDEEKNQKEEINFSFSSNTRRYHFGYNKGKPFFIIEYFDLLPDELKEEEKEKFIKETIKQGDAEKLVYVLKYGTAPELKEEIEKPNPNENKGYLIAQPRDFEKNWLNSFISDDANKRVLKEILIKNSKLNPEEISKIVEEIFEAYRTKDSEKIFDVSKNFPKEVVEMVRNEIRERMLPKPQEMEIAQLIEVLKNKKILFYTGAGISIASGILSMDQFKKNLGIDMAQKIDDLLKKAITAPESVINLWEEFVEAASEKPATPAHQSLAKLAQKLKAQIFTENVDKLHEKSGIRAIHITGPWLEENIQPEWLKDIDAVITIGLSHDDRGFLGWYKENNPNGKIIAIDLTQPSYLGNEDCILKGDCQEVIPELEKELIVKEQN